MEGMFSLYASTVYAIGAMAVVLLVQVVIADVVGIRNRHVPGTAPPETHGSTLFRVSRTIANTNETIAVFLCGVLFCMLIGASATYTAVSAWAYVCARVLYALCYYFNIPMLRSICFGLSLFALAGLLLVGFLS